jgi:hypothetical protein
MRSRQDSLAYHPLEACGLLLMDRLTRLSELNRWASLWLRVVTAPLRAALLKSPQDGAVPVVFLASCPPAVLTSATR